MEQLKEGEVICSRCNGGEYLERDRLWMSDNYITCLKCGGTGKLDWIENIVGKKTKFAVKAKIIPLEPTIVFLSKENHGTTKRRRNNLSKM